MFESYCARAGAVSSLHDADMDVGKQLADLEDLIVKKPDGVIIHPVDGDAAAPGADKLTAAGIPVFNYDVEVMSDNVLSFTTHNNVTMWKVIGEWTVDHFDKKGIPGVIYECQGAMEMRITGERHQGFLEAVEGSNVSLITGPDCAWADEECTNAVLAYVGAHPEVNGIYTHGGMLKGASEGLRSLDRLYPVGDPDHVVAVTVDANDSTCALIRDGWADAVTDHSPWEQTDCCTKAAFHYVILGNPVPEYIELPCKVVDYDMIMEDLERPIPTIWGVIMLSEIPWDDLAVLDMSEFIETPTLK